MATPRALPGFWALPQTFRCFALGRSARCLSTTSARSARAAKPRKPGKPAKATNTTPTAKSAKAAKPKPTKLPKPTRPTNPRPPPPPPSPSSLSSISYHPPPSNDPSQRAILSARPSPSALLSTTTLFTCRPPHFLFSAARFLQIPPNSHTPEVCLLGRSNAGKSTLINALAGLDGAGAGSAHGLRARAAGLAVTSRRAGSTTCINAYGFGPPAKAQVRDYYERVRAEREAVGGRSRAERRADRKECREPPPAHRLVVVDMPGYGLGSQQEWGVEIAKYLGKRKALRGAVVLVDAAAGLKDADRMVLEMLRDSEVRTAVVLTKADKVVGGGEIPRWGKVEEVCLGVWEELRNIELESLTWLEGKEKGWEKEIWVTGAGDPGSAGLGVAGARWAICRMAGVVEDERALEAPAVQTPAQKIVSFDQILWADRAEDNRPASV